MNTTNKIFTGLTFSAKNPHPTRHSSHCSKTLEPGIKKGCVILILWWFTRRSGIHKLFVRFIWIYFFLLVFCRALTEDFESEPELRRIFRKARVTVRVELRSQLQVWSLFWHFCLPLSTMDGFLKTATVKTTPSFSSFRSVRIRGRWRGLVQSISRLQFRSESGPK